MLAHPVRVVEESSLEKQLTAGEDLQKHRCLDIRESPSSMSSPLHLVFPGYTVWVKDWYPECLEPSWKEALTASLITPQQYKCSTIRNKGSWFITKDLKRRCQPLV